MQGGEGTQPEPGHGQRRPASGDRPAERRAAAADRRVVSKSARSPADRRVSSESRSQAAAESSVLWGVGAVSQRLGIATPTLRTWDRRYGLGPSAR